jgi:glycosyltransferase involved in cell wall biosynthesis
VNVELLRSLWPDERDALWMRREYVAGLASVIVPTYNRADVILDTLDSVWAQDYRPIELIVVDDGSTDSTSHVVDGWARMHPEDATFSVLYYYEENCGTPCARNRGLLECHGEYIQFLDSDDALHGEKLSTQAARLAADDAVDFVYSGTAHFCGEVDSSEPPYAGFAVSDNSLLPSYLSGRMWNTISGLYRRRACEAIGPWNQATPIYQDWEYNIRFILGSPNVEYLEGTLSYARWASTDRVTTSQTSEESLRGRLVSRREWSHWIRAAGLLDAETEWALAEQVFHVVTIALEQGFVRLAREAVVSLEGLRSDPRIARDIAIYSFLARLPGGCGPALARGRARLGRRDTAARRLVGGLSRRLLFRPHADDCARLDARKKDSHRGS